MICAGIDAGSRAIKAVLMSPETREIIGSGMVDQGVHQAKLALELVQDILKQNNLSYDDVGFTVATGYGRSAITRADKAVTEITCQARGVRSVLDDVRTIIEIGGQDSKVICIGEDGNVQDFQMNDRCAAGTGRFLEMVAGRLDVSMAEFGQLAVTSDSATIISSMCAVFAETEIIGLLAEVEEPNHIAAGVQAAVASRIVSLCGPSPQEPIAFAGGVALIPGMDQALSETLNCKVEVCRNPQMSGATGAAILACMYYGMK